MCVVRYFVPSAAAIRSLAKLWDALVRTMNIYIIILYLYLLYITQLLYIIIAIWIFYINRLFVAGDLRVCTYCCKVVLSYLQSSDMRSDLSEDLKALQEDLQVKYGNDQPPLTQTNANESVEDETSICRKPSVGYMEEKYAITRYWFLSFRSCF